jgi:hypothetical protein
VRTSLRQERRNAHRIGRGVLLGAVLLCLAQCSTNYDDPNQYPRRCIDTGQECATTGDNRDCCFGVCAGGGNPPHFTCKAICTQNSDCETGCCATILGTPQKGCSARGFCQDTCGKENGACDTDADCCKDFTCQTNNGSKHCLLPGGCVEIGQECSANISCCMGTCGGGGTPPHYTCQAPCTQGSDCPTGCCATIQGSGKMGCASRNFCPDTCGGPGVACNTNDDCCFNYTCLSYNGNKQCFASCKSGIDCKSGCCATIPGTSSLSCWSADACARDAGTD